MKGQKIPSLLFYLFHIGATLWGFTEQETVTGLFSKECILPCTFPPGDDEVIYWKKGDKNVHSYYYQSDQLERQDPDYRHRTHLFHENIPSGNASLKLSYLTVTDEGSYNCYVGTRQTKREVEVTLRVRVSSYYALEYQKTDTERMLKCYAFLTYPAPRISWLQGNTSIQETDRHETRDGVLYSLRSDQNIINTTDTYYCHIHLPHEEWAAEWKMQGNIFNWIKSNARAIPLRDVHGCFHCPDFPLKCTQTLSVPNPLHMLQNKSAVSNLHTIAYNMEGFKYGIIVGSNCTISVYFVNLSFRSTREKDPVSNVEGSSTAISCEYSNNAANTEGFSVVWTLSRNAVISVLASFNGTSHSYQPRVQINQNDFSLMLRDLTANDSGEYLCNISTPHYTKLTVRTLQVENSGNTWKIVLGVIAALVAAFAGVYCCIRLKKRRRGVNTLTY